MNFLKTDMEQIGALITRIIFFLEGNGSSLYKFNVGFWSKNLRSSMFKFLLSFKMSSLSYLHVKIVMPNSDLEI